MLKLFLEIHRVFNNNNKMNKEQGEAELEVIVAGFSRTGTGSLTAALEILLGRPCYHTNNLVSNTALQQQWVEMIDTGFREDALMRDAFKHYAAGADLPIDFQTHTR